MKLSTRIIAAILLVVGSSGLVYAVSTHGDWGMTAAEKIDFVSDRVTRKLDLNETQRQKFIALAESNSPAVGMSHVVLARRNGDGTLVEKIENDAIPIQFSG